MEKGGIGRGSQLKGASRSAKEEAFSMAGCGGGRGRGRGGRRRDPSQGSDILRWRSIDVGKVRDGLGLRVPGDDDKASSASNGNRRPGSR